MDRLLYGPSLSKQDDWKERAGTIAGTAHTQEYLLLHLAMFPIGSTASSNHPSRKEVQFGCLGEDEPISGVLDQLVVGVIVAIGYGKGRDCPCWGLVQ